MKLFRFAALALLAPCAAFANATDDAQAGGGAVIGNVGMSIDIVGDSTLKNHTGSSHAIDSSAATDVPASWRGPST